MEGKARLSDQEVHLMVRAALAFVVSLMRNKAETERDLVETWVKFDHQTMARGDEEVSYGLVFNALPWARDSMPPELLPAVGRVEAIVNEHRPDHNNN